MSGVYSLSTTVDITFILPKLDLKKPTKKQTFQTPSFALCGKLSNFSLLFFFTYHSQKFLQKRSIITCRRSLLTYHTQKYFIKSFCYLAKTWLSLIWRHLSFSKAYSKCVLLCWVSVRYWVNKRIKPTQKQKAFRKTCCKLKKHSGYIKLGLTLENSTTLKIGVLLLTANSPNISDVGIWRVTVNG